MNKNEMKQGTNDARRYKMLPSFVPGILEGKRIYVLKKDRLLHGRTTRRRGRYLGEVTDRTLRNVQLD